MNEIKLQALKRVVMAAKSNHWTTVTITIATLEELIAEVENGRDQ